MLTAALVGKWLVFWMVGVRLFLAGLRQIVQPQYTAEQILGVEDPDAALIVRELGIANTAVGSVAVASLFFRNWGFPMALVGTIFYALAGINHLRSAAPTTLALLTLFSVGPGDAADAANSIARKSIGALNRTAVIHLGKTADWVAISADAVWVGSTGPFAVHRIDPATNKRVASVQLPGEPCAGLAIGADSLWVPLCGAVPLLAKVDLKSNRLVSVFKTGPAAAEGGVTASPGNVWLVIDKQGSLAHVDPDTGIVRQITHLPAGSYNPIYSDGKIWITHADGSDVTSVDAATGAILATFPTGPGPRFLTAGSGAIWTLNQGDGSVTRIDTGAKRATITTALGIPGKGGDIGFGGGMIWATAAKVPLSLVDGASGALLCQWVGPGGDSLGIGHGAIWLTDYHAGTISRIELEEAILHCRDH